MQMWNTSHRHEAWVGWMTHIVWSTCSLKMEEAKAFFFLSCTDCSQCSRLTSSPRAGFFSPSLYLSNVWYFAAFCCLTVIIYSHSCSRSELTSPPPLSPSPPCPLSHARFTTPLLLLNAPPIIYSSPQQMTGRLGVVEALGGAIQSHGVEWQRVATITMRHSVMRAVDS